MDFLKSCGNQDLGPSDLKNSIVALFYAHPIAQWILVPKIVLSMAL